jgi:hypothetical protein
MREFESLLKYYRKMKFPLEAVNPQSKTPVKIPVRYCLEHGGNVALGYVKGSEWLVLDLDTHRIAKPLKPIFRNTPIIKSPKGHGIIVRSDKVSEGIAPIVRGYKGSVRDFERWWTTPLKSVEWMHGFMARCRKLGFKDNTFIKGLAPDVDSHSYYLLPPSITCRYEGGKDITVKLHSWLFPFCNCSPTGKHEFVERTWLNQTEDAVTFSEFLDVVEKKI